MGRCIIKIKMLYSVKMGRLCMHLRPLKNKSLKTDGETACYCQVTIRREYPKAHCWQTKLKTPSSWYNYYIMQKVIFLMGKQSNCTR